MLDDLDLLDDRSTFSFSDLGLGGGLGGLDAQMSLGGELGYEFDSTVRDHILSGMVQTKPQAEPIFTLHDLPIVLQPAWGPIVTVKSVGAFLFLLTEANFIVRIAISPLDGDGNCQVESQNADCRAPGHEMIRHFWPSPDGTWVLLALTNNDTHIYSYSHNSRDRVSKLSGKALTAAAWLPREFGSDSPNEVLAATQDGKLLVGTLHATKAKVSTVNHVTTLSPSQDILQEVLEPTLIQVSPNADGLLVVILAQSMVFLARGGRSFHSIFGEGCDIKQRTIKSRRSRTHLSLYGVEDGAGVRSYAWLTHAGLLYGDIDYESPRAPQLAQQRMIDWSEDLHAEGETPVAVTRSRHHLIVFWRDASGVSVRAYSALDPSRIVPVSGPELAESDNFIDVVEQVVVTDRRFIFSRERILEIVSINEDRDVWRVYLDQEEFQKAMMHGDADWKREIIRQKEGQFHYNHGRYLEAAKLWGNSSMPYEEVCLAFLEHREALIQYYTILLMRHAGQAAECVRIVGLLIEEWLARINEASGRERVKIVDEFKAMIHKHRDLIKKVPHGMLSILAPYGHHDLITYVATEIGDYDTALPCLIRDQNYSEAISHLLTIGADNHEPVYQYSHILVSFRPEETVRMWKTIARASPNLDPKRLLPCLIQVEMETLCDGRQVISEIQGHKNQAAAYLRFVLNQEAHKGDPSLNNILLFLYIEQGHLDRVKGYLESTSRRAAMDLKYLLRLARQRLDMLETEKESAERISNAAGIVSHLFYAMDLVEDAVDVSLQYNNVETALAFIAAVDGRQKELLRKLNLKVSIHMLNSGVEIAKVIEFVTNSKHVTVRDILPHFPASATMSDIRPLILRDLADYGTQIDRLRHDMDLATQLHHWLLQRTSDHEKAPIVIRSGAVCSSCEQSLVRQGRGRLFAFRCGHGFCSEACLREGYTRLYGPESSMVRILVEIEEQIAAARSGLASPGTEALDIDELKLRRLRHLTERCPVCGDPAQSLSRPLL